VLSNFLVFVVVDEDFELLKDLDVFLNVNADLFEASAKVVVVGIRNLVKELDTSVLHRSHCRDYIVRAHGNVLDASAAIILDIFLNLAFSDSISGLIYGHLDALVEVGHDN